MSAHSQQSSCTLGAIRDYDGQFCASGLHRPGHPHRDFTVASRCVEHQMEIILRIGVIEEQLFEVRDTRRPDDVDHHHQAGPMRLLVLAD